MLAKQEKSAESRERNEMHSEEVSQKKVEKEIKTKDLAEAKEQKTKELAEAKEAKEQKNKELAEAKEQKNKELALAKEAKEQKNKELAAEKEQKALALVEAKAAEKEQKALASAKAKETKTKTKALVEAKASVKAEVVVEPVVKVTVKRVTIQGKEYLKSSNNMLYDPVSKDELGIWNPETESIDKLPEESDNEEVEDEYETDSD